VKAFKIILIAAAVCILLPPSALTITVLFFPVDKGEIERSLEPSTRIYDRRGTLLREIVNVNGERCNPVRLQEISPLLVKAVLAAEDATFYSHKGINYLAALRAFIDNRRSGRIVSGASTITMQLARLLWNHPRTFAGKMRQAFDAIRLEHTYGTNEILELYFNRVPVAPGCQGIEAASIRITGRSASELNAAEAESVAASALLAGMIQAPGLNDPFAYNDAALRSRDQTLSRMRKRRHISKKVYEAALAAPLPLEKPETPIQAGHFTDYVMSLGLRGDVYTSLDGEMQEAAQNLAAAHAGRFRPDGLTNSAIVVLDNNSAEILVMVGSKDWSADEKGYVNGAIALRQPGSTLKPFAYALAFDRGWNAASLLADIETEYVSNDRTLYIPRNYSRSFRGPVTAKEALASSLNIPAIRLVRDLGLNDFLECLQTAGFHSLDKNADYYGLGLVLGNGEVSLLQLAGAYSALARGGLYVPPVAQNVNGREEQVNAPRIFSEQATWQITSILSDESLRVQTFGAMTPLLFGFPVAVKTGTSGDWRDSWTAGFTGEYTVAVWSGDFESVSMNQVSGSSGAGILFSAMIRLLSDNAQAAGLTIQPTGLKQPTVLKQSLGLTPPHSMRGLVICAESGGFPHDFCPRKITVSLPASAEIAACTVHSLAGDPPRLAYNLPAEYDLWLRDNARYVPERASRESTGQRDIRISRPREGDIYITEPGYNPAYQTLEFAATSDSRLPKIRWYLNGKAVGEASWPYGFNWQLAKGTYSLVARSGGLESEQVHFEVR
jgi:penicillin-binding protein 1C